MTCARNSHRHIGHYTLYQMWIVLYPHRARPGRTRSNAQMLKSSSNKPVRGTASMKYAISCYDRSYAVLPLYEPE